MQFMLQQAFGASNCGEKDLNARILEVIVGYGAGLSVLISLEIIVYRIRNRGEWAFL